MHAIVRSFKTAARPQRLALLFPGQGAQQPGMGRDLADAFAIARDTFQEIDEALGESLSRTMFTGSQVRGGASGAELAPTDGRRACT